MIFTDVISILNLKTVCANAFKTTVQNMEGKTRKQKAVKARQLCMTILNLDGYSLSETGKLFNRDHATTIHAKKSIYNLIETKDKIYYPSIKEVLDKYDFHKKLNNTKTENND